MVDFLRTWGALIVAFAALIQPWVRAGWRKLFRQQHVDIFETGSIEIGFSVYGPTVGLQGTLRAIHNDAFISSIKLHVVRKKDQLQHAFDWGVFRSPTVSFDPNASSSFELCRSFHLSQHFPSSYSILFWDRDTQQELRPLLEQIRSTWTDYFMNQGGQDIMARGADAVGVAHQLHELTRSLYRQFQKDPFYVEIYSAVQRLFYWEPGSYTNRDDRVHKSAGSYLHTQVAVRDF